MNTYQDSNSLGYIPKNKNVLAQLFDSLRYGNKLISAGLVVVVIGMGATGVYFHSRDTFDTSSYAPLPAAPPGQVQGAYTAPNDNQASASSSSGLSYDLPTPVASSIEGATPSPSTVASPSATASASTTPSCTSTNVPDQSHSSLSFSSNSITADGSSTSTITVVLEDSSGCSITGASLNLSDSLGGTVTPQNGGSNITDGSGHAYFTFRAPSIVGSTNGTADSISLQDFTGTTTTLTNLGSISLNDLSPSPSAGNSTVVAGSSPVTVSTGSTTITITLKDNSSSPQPISGKTIQLNKTGNAVISPSTSGTTGSNGQVQFTVTDATAETVTFTAVDQSDGNMTISQTASVTFQ